MAIRFRSDFTSMDGVGWRIDIIDTEFSGSITEFTTGMDSNDGFTLSYEGENQERWNPIISSNVVVNMAVETALLDAFINDLISQPEARFYIDIRKKVSDVPVSYARHWFGEIATDLITIEDRQRPYLFQITAFDNFTKFQYLRHTLKQGDTHTFIDLLIHALSKLNYYDQLGTGYILATSVDWYENKMFTGASPASTLDPLKQSRIMADTFINIDQDGVQTDMTIWEMLEQVCYRWNARFLQADGMFQFIQVNIDDPTAMVFRKYTKTLTTTTETIDKTVSGTDIIRTDGSFNFLPILGEVQAKYNYKQSVYAGNLLPTQSSYAALVNIGTIQGGEGEQLIFSGNIRVQFSLNGQTQDTTPVFWFFKMRVQVGTRYLTNKNGYYEWTTTSTDRVEILGGPFAEESDYDELIPVSFTTPAIPTTGNGYFELDFIEYQSPQGTTYTLRPGTTGQNSCIGFNMRLLVDDTLDAGTILFNAINDEYTQAKYNSLKKLPDMITGDPEFSYDVGRMQVYNASTSSWENSDQGWSVGGAGTGININDLLVFEVLAGQTKACRTFIGGIWSILLDATKVIRIDGINYSFHSGIFNANYGRWDGQWIRLYINRSNITGGGGGSADVENIQNLAVLLANSAGIKSAVRAAVAQAAAEAARDQALLYEGEAGDQAALSLTYKNASETAKTAAEAAQAAAEAAQDAAEAAQAAAEAAQTECEAIRDELTT